MAAIGAHERQVFDKLLWGLVTSTIFVRWSGNKLISHLLYNYILTSSTTASSKPFPVGSPWGWGMLVHQNHAAGEENGSIMVGMFVSLCFASKTDFFFSTVTELSW